MMEKYIIGIDQSTQGTKALLFDSTGKLLGREDLLHEQLINDKGWVSHDASQIYENTVSVVQKLVEKTNIDKQQIAGIGISNQRETSVAWNKMTGEPIDHAIVWQCARAKDLCRKIEEAGAAEEIRRKTGLFLSPYFPASKFAWFLKNRPEAKTLAQKGELCLGTIDSWLVYRLTGGRCFRTDYSNASRTQLFNLYTLSWDQEICDLFQIPISCLPQVMDSNGDFGETDLEGYFDRPVPIRGVLGDSHGALFGQGCHKKGMVKSTYGTGSSIMMNIGEIPVLSSHGVVTSLAWGIDGTVEYVLEGNINYTGAVVTWLIQELKLIQSAAETEALADMANKEDQTYLVPAFSGLGAPYWDSDATASISGLTRTTGKAEIVRAGLDCIAYQITDIVQAMGQDAGIPIRELRVDGGPTRNRYLMQFQSDIAGVTVQVPEAEELSGIGAAYMAGIALGVFDRDGVFTHMSRKTYVPMMEDDVKNKKYAGWKAAVGRVLTK
ncbi:MAG: glycerol kinase [Lachnospiraceae bacterium]